MGSYLSSPNGDQDIEHGAGAGLSFGVCNVQGWRRNQEDAHIAAPAFDEERGVSLFAVFDGHGGAEVALYCEANFGRALRGTRAYADGDYAVALRDAFLRIDDMLRTEEGFAEVCRLKLDHDAKQASINDAHAARTAGKNGESRGDFQSIDIASLISKGGAEDGGDNSKGERDAAAAATDEGQDGEEFISVGNGIRISRSSFEKILQAQIRAQVDAVRNSLDNDGYEEGADDAVDADESDGTVSSSGAGDDGSSSEVSEDGSTAAHTSTSASAEQENVFKDDAVDMEDEEDDERPSYASGCTAVVALLDQRTNVVYVANAGDSRCVLARKDKAISLSEDHKPEDRVEITRINKAGGHVTDEGRVNGCLNLSRAIGDLRYKTNRNLRPDEQIISCHPDVVRCQLDPAEGDKYLVLMCDGITGSLTNQEVVDRVVVGVDAKGKGRASSSSSSSDDKKAVNASEDANISATLARICSEICDECMSRDIDSNDGAGCDNETFMLVQLSSGQASGSGATRSAGSSPSAREPTTLDLPPLPPVQTVTKTQSTGKRSVPGEHAGEVLAAAPCSKRQKVSS